jgi:hypothetical protein
MDKRIHDASPVDCAAWDGKLWVLGGHRGPADGLEELWTDGNRNDVWCSSDGVRWHELRDTPWSPRHGIGVNIDGGDLCIVVRTHYGPCTSTYDETSILVLMMRSQLCELSRWSAAIKKCASAFVSLNQGGNAMAYTVAEIHRSMQDYTHKTDGEWLPADVWRLVRVRPRL